jgi:hypothetical protein
MRSQVGGEIRERYYKLQYPWTGAGALIVYNCTLYGVYCIDFRTYFEPDQYYMTHLL